MKIKATRQRWADAHEFGTMLFDIEADPEELHPISDAKVESRLTEAMIKLMRENDAPKEQFERLGLA